MREFKRSMILKDAKWVIADPGERPCAIVNSIIDDTNSVCVVFVVFTDKKLEPLIHLCAVARSLEFIDFEQRDVLLFGHNLRLRKWLHQGLGSSAGGARSVGTSLSVGGMRDIENIVRLHGVVLEHEFKDRIDQSLALCSPLRGNKTCAN